MSPQCCLWLCLAALLVTGCPAPDAMYPQRSVPVAVSADPAAVARGKAAFMLFCAHCHGTVAEGRNPRAGFYRPPAPDFRSGYADCDPAYLFWRIETGKTVEPYRSQGSVMPDWGRDLSETDIWQLVLYLQQRSR